MRVRRLTPSVICIIETDGSYAAGEEGAGGWEVAHEDEEASDEEAGAKARADSPVDRAPPRPQGGGEARPRGPRIETGGRTGRCPRCEG